MTDIQQTLSHVDEHGKAKMVSISEKSDTLRTAVAVSSVFMNRNTLKLIRENQIKKGDVLATAQIAGIMAAKNTSQYIPLCHPIRITGIDIQFTLQKDLSDTDTLSFSIDRKDWSKIIITSTVSAIDKTGVEMEAFTACSIAALTIYDMCKAVDKSMIITNMHLQEKRGGKSGTYTFSY